MNLHIVGFTKIFVARLRVKVLAFDRFASKAFWE